MHESISISHLQEIKTVALQNVFFISAFQGYIMIQSIIGSVFSLALFTWIMSKYDDFDIILSAVFGLVFSLIMTIILKLPKNRSSFFIVYYYMIQPLVLYYTVPLFVIQTKYPVGYPVAFLIWLAVNLLVYYHHDPLPLFNYVAIFSMIVFSLTFGFFIYKRLWIAILLSSSSQIISTIFSYYMFIN